MEWDAQRVSRNTEGGGSRIYTEPWTGDRFWEVQVSAFDQFHFGSHDTHIFKVVIAGGRKDGLP